MLPLCWNHSNSPNSHQKSSSTFEPSIKRPKADQLDLQHTQSAFHHLIFSFLAMFPKTISVSFMFLMIRSELYPWHQFSLFWVSLYFLMGPQKVCHSKVNRLETSRREPFCNDCRRLCMSDKISNSLPYHIYIPQLIFWHLNEIKWYFFH